MNATMNRNGGADHQNRSTMRSSTPHADLHGSTVHDQLKFA